MLFNVWLADKTASDEGLDVLWVFEGKKCDRMNTFQTSQGKFIKWEAPYQIKEDMQERK